jgi:hypothetical protein
MNPEALASNSVDGFQRIPTDSNGFQRIPTDSNVFATIPVPAGRGRSPRPGIEVDPKIKDGDDDFNSRPTVTLYCPHGSVAEIKNPTEQHDNHRQNPPPIPTVSSLGSESHKLPL